jgi:ubiquinone/menaquinone biosynthesis C-methylase UbiE
MSWLVPPRRPSRELLDDPDLPSGEMRQSLEDIDLAHRRWGGSRALARHLAPRVRALGRPASILDVGAGSATVARRLRASLSSAAGKVQVVALDVQWRHLVAGRSLSPREPVPLVGADAFRLPFSTRAFDFAVSTLFFHHFSPAENQAILGELSRVSRHGFAVLDLRRHLVPELVLRLAGRRLFRAQTSILDGIASVRQAYTTEEARDIARAVTPSARAVRVFPYGLLVTGGA